MAAASIRTTPIANTVRSAATSAIRPRRLRLHHLPRPPYQRGESEMAEHTPTPEQLAACERAMDGLEAQADIWADEIDLVAIVKNIGQISRGLTDRMPKDIR